MDKMWKRGHALGTQGVGRRRRCRRHHRRRKCSAATAQADVSAPEATGGDAALLQVPGRCVRAVVRCQQMFRYRRRARDEEEHRRRREQRARAELERVDSCRRYLVDAIGRLVKRYGTGKNVWLTVDKLLRADEEGADVEAMAGIVRGFKAQQLTRKLGCVGD